MHRTLRVLGLLLLSALTACSSYPREPGVAPNLALTTPTIEYLHPEQLDPTINCIADSRALRGMTIAVTAWVDTTGRINQVAEGGPNGTFLPQGGTSAYATAILRSLGATVMATYNLQGEQTLRVLGSPEVVAHLTSQVRVPDYFLNGMFVSFDVEEQKQLDAQVAGFGALYQEYMATVGLAVELNQPGSTVNQTQFIASRDMFSRRGGVTFGRVIDTTLLTGEAILAGQQPIQLETSQLLVSTSVLAAVSRLPAVPARCRALMDAFLNGSPPSAPAPLPAAPAGPGQPLQLVAARS